MGLDHKQRFCEFCKRETIFQRPGANHGLHLALTFLTFGLWVLIWVLVALGAFRYGWWMCSRCGGSGRAPGYKRTSLPPAPKRIYEEPIKVRPPAPKLIDEEPVKVRTWAVLMVILVLIVGTLIFLLLSVRS